MNFFEIASLIYRDWKLVIKPTLKNLRDKVKILDHEYEIMKRD